MTKICMAGVTGWTGKAITAGILEAPDLELTGALARKTAGLDVGDALDRAATGVTITAGLFLGMTRETASRFSFLLAIPIIVLASAVKLLEVATSDVIVDWNGFLIGGVTSFLMAITAIHFFLKWLNKVGMWPYVIYRIILAGVIYAVLM